MNNALINGQPGDKIAVSDRALHYGDGLFETIAVVKGTPRLWERHLQRLRFGCERLGIPVPDTELLRKELAQVAQDEAACVIKIIVTRGSGGRGYRPPAAAEPTRLVLRYPFPAYPLSNSTQGIEIRLCETPLGCNPRLAGIKHLNRLEQVLARSEWDIDSIAEGVMLDGDGHLIDGTMSNLFLVIDDALYTPDLSRCGVEGVVRSAIIDITRRQNIPLHIVPLKSSLLDKADEIFVTNALIGIWPVIGCGKHRYAVGTLTRQLQHQLASLMEFPNA